MVDPAGAREAVKRDLALEALASFGEVRLSVQGASMVPALWPGDTLLVRRVHVEELSPGDIVVCRRDGGLRIHRLLAKAAGGGGTLLVTRGDALSENDPPVAASELLGRVSAVISGRRLRVPRPRLSFGGTAVAFLVRRSAWAMRLLLRTRSAAASVAAGRGLCLR
jgi:signal peptidase I